MPEYSVLERRFWKPLRVFWAVFLVYGPACAFALLRFHWQILTAHNNLAMVAAWSFAASWFCCLATIGVLLFIDLLKALLPALIFLLDCLLLLTPLNNALQVKSFADYCKPEHEYIAKHCAPMHFVQDGKTYVLGICDLAISPNGEDDFDLVYDTSGDTGNYASLSEADQKAFALATRKYFNDDPNDDWEVASFMASRYYQDFFQVSFNDPGNTFGFRADYGPPPKNPKSPYPFIFEGP